MASFFSCTATIFLTISTFSINGCNAYGALIEGICKQSQDYKYCMSVVGNDPRAAAADLHRLALLSIQVKAIQIQDTLDQISRIHPNLKDPLALRPLRQCKSDYDEAYTNLQSSFSSTSKTAYTWELQLTKSLIVIMDFGGMVLLPHHQLTRMI
ncbi:hypothetical protein ES332_A11G121900v1 [Gossypium tomentosum]|uniref:Pectinesterase inhibitor domain-containing protein n=1 Tax=Gossypium tomentosum TaxID=34277 RepID=A0A5D2NCM1_GOSTO|nr:hypothetical protein ES332_A11G121900v1 [Gossypium tomentosum]